MTVNSDPEVASAARDNAGELSDSTVSAPFGFTDPGFANAVSGEWFGYECAFSGRDGEPMNIPVR